MGNVLDHNRNLLHCHTTCLLCLRYDGQWVWSLGYASHWLGGWGRYLSLCTTDTSKRRCTSSSGRGDSRWWKKLDGADDGMIFGLWVPEGVCCCCWLALVISFAAAVSCLRLREELPEGSAAGEIPYELSSVLAALVTSATMGPLVAPVGQNTNWPLPFLRSKAWTCSKWIKPFDLKGFASGWDCSASQRHYF